MNPVRANIVATPEKYVWSSHNAYLGLNEITWVTNTYGLAKFGQNIDEARLFYSAYVLKQESREELNELRNQFRDGQVLGDDDFLHFVREKNAIQIEKNIPLTAILKATCHVLDIHEEFVILPGKSQKASFARALVALIASETQKIPIEQIAFLMGRDGSTISSLLARFSTRYAQEAETRELLERIKVKANQIAELQA
jgi:hypothetical protein